MFSRTKLKMFIFAIFFLYCTVFVTYRLENILYLKSFKSQLKTYYANELNTGKSPDKRNKVKKLPTKSDKVRIIISTTSLVTCKYLVVWLDINSINFLDRIRLLSQSTFGCGPPWSAPAGSLPCGTSSGTRCRRTEAFGRSRSPSASWGSASWSIRGHTLGRHRGRIPAARRCPRLEIDFGFT